jgi:hypothetical protein
MTSNDQPLAVWVDRSALTIETTVDGAQAARSAPDEEAIAHLVEAGWRVFRIPAASGDANGLPEGARGWLLTSDQAQARAVRHRRGLRTVLVGPETPDRGPAGRAADLEARGLLEAVLMVLSADAMPAVTRPPTPERPVDRAPADL